MEAPKPNNDIGRVGSGPNVTALNLIQRMVPDQSVKKTPLEIFEIHSDRTAFGVISKAVRIFLKYLITYIMERN